MTKSPKDQKTERLKDRKTDKVRDRKTERQKNRITRMAERIKFIKIVIPGGLSPNSISPN